MTVGDETPRAQRAGLAAPAWLRRAAASPRLCVYTACTLAAVLVSFLLGKELLWDTMYYHVYAGFSALHDRFGRDYFAAGPQAYFNPYGYVPFYLLIRTRLAPLAVASILAVLQSAILWLTYELAITTVPHAAPRTRVLLGVLAAVFAFANPILLNEFGSSFIDVTTAELVLAGWLILLGALRAPRMRHVVAAAVLLGVASALKPTNAVHALAGTTLLFFLPGGWGRRIWAALLFGLGGAAGFVLANLPWSIHLQRHFGNPLFPLLNGLFRSPNFWTGSMLDYRFIPVSWTAALLRPFALLRPLPMLQYELAAPDIRYALLAVTALALAARALWRRVFGGQEFHPEEGGSRALIALGSGFLVDWILWLTVSGNGRYFIPMACVAGVLAVVLVFRLLAGRPRARAYTLTALVALQLFQLYVGSGYRVYLPWGAGPWYHVSLPRRLAGERALYFMVGTQTNSYIIPDMPKRDGFVNLGGNFMLTADGPNGARVKALIRRFAPNWWAVQRDPRSDAMRESGLAGRSAVNNALRPYGLAVAPGQCSKIVVSGVAITYTVAVAGGSPNAPHTEYLTACRVERLTAIQTHWFVGRRSADLALDHLAAACPALFKPRRPGDRIQGDRRYGYYLARVYADTGVIAWVTHGAVEFQKLIGGREQNAGPEALWQRTVPKVACSRNGSTYLHILGGQR